MSNNFDFTGSFAHDSTNPAAPNPCIMLEGVGIIGLPLSPRDAHLLIQTSRPAPFGQADRTVVDKNVRYTWEIQPEQLAFTNPEWKTYVNTMAVAVCNSLGAHVGAEALHCELYKMLLYEPGCQ